MIFSFTDGIDTQTCKAAFEPPLIIGVVATLKHSDYHLSEADLVGRLLKFNSLGLIQVALKLHS